MSELLLSSIYAALEAGYKIMEVYHSKIRISIKRNLTPVTNADKFANQIIIDRLAPFNISMISEETKIAAYEERRKWEYCWLVDPLDGTKDFISHRTDFTVNIALIKKDVPVLGVIYAPVYDQLYFATKELGSFRLNNASVVLKNKLPLDLIVAESVKLPDTKTVTYTFVVSRSHINRKTQKYLEYKTNEKIFISKGSSLKLCALAEGSADEYPRFGRTMEWDIAAGDAILRGASGKILNTGNSEPLKYNKEDLANPEFIAHRSANK